MTQRPTTQEQAYLAALESFEGDGYANDPSWAHDLRRAAMSRFQSLGFPIARRGNEEWKYTDVGPIAKATFQSPDSATPPRVDVGEVKGASFGDSGWTQLVFVNGIYDEGLSSVYSFPAGVVVMNLAEAMRLSPDLVREHLANHADYQANAFTALNTAFIHEGAFVHVPDGILVEEPIRLLFLSTFQEQETVSHSRVLIVVGKDSKVAVIEGYGCISNGRYFSNSVTEIVVGDRAKVEYYKIQQQSDKAFHITTTNVALGLDSYFSSINIDLGGRLVRNNLNVLTEGEGSSSMLNGLYLVNGTQHVDNQVIIDHAKPYTTSRELYKGILDDKSRSVFHGSIIVREGAVRVNANQVDKNLLLSDQAEADTKPAFWIYCDDVKCGHGAACGHMDENALFYLRSRGIDEKTARGLLTHAFVSEVIESIANEPLRGQVDGLVQAKLQEWLGS
ncbi:Fe-S cluster assembly protein SufD [SAR202 cluster bacterium AC-647-N09_OGT_505m]|nr:Fe-S cluster assembly protein SufD [SAR202 cluster bacterium AC-647-N09_OGT_505m]